MFHVCHCVGHAGNPLVHTFLHICIKSILKFTIEVICGLFHGNESGRPYEAKQKIWLIGPQKLVADKDPSWCAEKSNFGDTFP